MKRDNTNKEEEEEEEEEEEGIITATNDEIPELSSIPIIIRPNTRGKPPGVIFILENAALEVAKVGKNYELLNGDDHATFLMRNKKDPSHYRQLALLSIYDSTIAMSGRLQAVYVKTQQNSLIEVKPHNPVTQHLSPNSRKIGFSYSSDKLVKIRSYVDTNSSDTDLVFVVGAMAHGKIQNDYTDDCIAISSCNLSDASCIKSICLALADKWDIL
ncbi:hypothetical protein ACFE04_030730 [Oxalis oulophora]